MLQHVLLMQLDTCVSIHTYIYILHPNLFVINVTDTG